MDKIYTTQSFIDSIYKEPNEFFDEFLIDYVIADDSFLEMIALEAEEMLANLGLECQPSKKTWLLIEQMASVQYFCNQKLCLS
ncbi:MAG: hypothetical protein GX259_10380 [Bacteroidales bacterium]|nr:hypothetical protein [Bacteroidales bacterium]